MKIRSKAPLRLGLAGGGTDVSPYSDEFGGCVLNAAINMYAYAFIDDDISSNTLDICALDLGIAESLDLSMGIEIEGKLTLHRAVYKRIMIDFNNGQFIPLHLATRSDAPPGSGLGSSSTVVVAILEGLRQLLSLPLGEYDIAKLAYEIEREDCGLAGGKQDQYAATFGGFNFMEFYEEGRVIVNPLRIRRYIVNELESSIILYFTGASRSSAKIIDDQKNAIKNDSSHRLAAMHEVRESAHKMKELLFKADIEGVAGVFRESWIAKKTTSESISNENIEKIEKAMIEGGALGLKVSGAGGGGFIMIMVEPEKKLKLQRILEKFDGEVHKFQFTEEGAYSWTI